MRTLATADDNELGDQKLAVSLIADPLSPSESVLDQPHELSLPKRLRQPRGRCLTTKTGHSRWAIRLDTGLHPDLTVAVRMAEGNDDVLDYYLLPAIDITVGKLRLAHDNGVGLDAYRFATLDYLFGMAERVHLREAA